MAKSLNNVLIMGNLTRDPEAKEVGGQTVVNFSLALNRSYKDAQGEWQEATDYVDVVAWGTLASQIQDTLKKGQRVLVDGRLQSRTWETEGMKKSKLEVLALDATFLGRPTRV